MGGDVPATGSPSVSWLELERLAVTTARRLQQRHARLFTQLPVRTAPIARTLGIAIEKRVGLGPRAQLEARSVYGRFEATIVIRPKLDHAVGRFAIAHEIGHAILLRDHSELAKELNLDAREAFSNQFAESLLVPEPVARRVGTRFREFSRPEDLLDVSDYLGLSISATLTVATSEKWLHGSSTFWFRVKFMPNRFTGDEPALRIVSAHYDRERYFVAENQRVANVLGCVDWLAHLSPGQTVTHNATITIKCRTPGVPKFLTTTTRAELAALRLREGRHDSLSYFVVVALASAPSGASDGDR